MANWGGTAAVLALATLAVLITPSSSQSCSTTLTVQNSQSIFTQCRALTQGASLAWTYHSVNRTLDIGFSGTLPSTSGWLAWGYNPSQPAMEGTSALIAYTSSASQPRLNLYSVSGATKSGSALTPTNSTADVLAVLSRSVAIQGTAVTFSATLQLAAAGSSSAYHIWNKGSSVSGDSPASHALDSEHTTSAGQINLATGEAGGVAAPRLHLKNAHGVLNAVGWGILLPIGAVCARHLRSFEWADPTWFYLHVLMQTVGYILGVVGWAIGLRLGSDSVGVTYDSHRSIAIAMFVFGTLQVFAIVLRPNKSHQYRKFWNVYHHSLGYTTIVLAIVNIFKGFDILQPAKGWKRAYIGCIIAVGVAALVLEVITWIAYFGRRRSGSEGGGKRKQSNPYANGHEQEQHGLRV